LKKYLKVKRALSAYDTASLNTFYKVFLKAQIDDDYREYNKHRTGIAVEFLKRQR
jgi:hypothetical protein